MIIDCHVHLRGDYGSAQDAGDIQVKYADRLGIDRMCLSLGNFRTGIFDEECAPAEFMIRHNDDVWRVCERHPERFIPFCYLNPCYLSDSLQEIERCIVNGPFRGIKLGLDMFCDQPNLDVLASRAAELSVPVLQHTWIKTTGNFPHESEPWRLADLAERHGETTFMMAHSGGNWEKGLKTIIDQANIVTDICGGDPEIGEAEMAVRLVGVERVVYGSDAPGRSYASQIAEVLGADLTEDEKAAILGGNMRRVLGL